MNKTQQSLCVACAKILLDAVAVKPVIGFKSTHDRPVR